MELIIFGSSINSSSVTGRATPWRGLIRSLEKLGHHIVFFEHNDPQQEREPCDLSGCEVAAYSDWKDARTRAAQRAASADAVIVGSDSPDAVSAAQLALDSAARVRSYYDLETGATLDRLRSGRPVDYLPEGGLGDFDLVLSSCGGHALAELKTRANARHVAPLYASVDPDAHRPSAPDDRFRGDLSYLCGCTPDRQAALDSLLYEPARRRPDLRFVVGGGQRPTGLQWTANLVYVADVPLADRPAFYCSSRLSLNVTPGPMSETGYCPPAGLFEAAACGVPVLSDDWEGLDYFFEPGLEILIARTTGHVMDALARSPEDLARIARAGRDRVLAAHTSDRRALELENLLEAALSLPVERAGQADA